MRIRNHIPSQQRLRHRVNLIVVRPIRKGCTLLDGFRTAW